MKSQNYFMDISYFVVDEFFFIKNRREWKGKNADYFDQTLLQFLSN